MEISPGEDNQSEQNISKWTPQGKTEETGAGCSIEVSNRTEIKTATKEINFSQHLWWWQEEKVVTYFSRKDYFQVLALVLE